MESALQLVLTRREKEELVKNCIEMLHSEIDNKNKVYFSVMQIEKGTVKNKFFKSTGEFVNWMIEERVLENKNTDTYYSINEFNCPWRKSQYVFSYQAFYYDLDLHGEKNLVKINHILDKLMDYIIYSTNKKDMLLPSIIVSSGRGMHLYYVMDKSLPRKKLEWLYSKISEKLAEPIRELLNYLEEDIDIKVTLDNCYQDISRVLRIPYTYNTNSNSYSEIMYLNNEMKYPMEKLREYSEVPAKQEVKVKTNKNNRIKKVAYINKGLQLHNDRLSDLLKLLDIRNYNVMGKREVFLFLIRYYNNFVNIGNSDILISEINSKLSEPLIESELLYTRSANKAYYEWKIDKKKGYNYKNKTLIELLEITEGEQRELKTIISYTEKKYRAKNNNWYNDKRDKERKDKRLELDNQIADMIKEGYTYKHIVKILNVSEQRISRVKKSK